MIPAMVLAAGLGTRLRPLTFEIPKPMVPVLDRPIMAHIVDLLHRQGIDRIVANLHYFPETIQRYFGDTVQYRYEQELKGTAGGVRNCSDFFGDSTFLVISGDALTDLDIHAFLKAHRESGAVATLAVKRVENTSEYGVVLHDSNNRITGFQEKPDPTEALSDLGNCGIYLFEPEIFDYFPPSNPVDWAHDVFPKLLEHDVPFYVHEINGYWNDVGSLQELQQGTFDALEGRVQVEQPGKEIASNVFVGQNSLQNAEQAIFSPPVWIGEDVTIAKDVMLTGPVVIGDGATIGRGARLRETIVLPGTTIASDAILIGSIAGHVGITDSLHQHRTPVALSEDDES